MNAFQLRLIENLTSHARLICNHYQTKTHLLELAKRRSNAGKQRNLLWLREIFTLFDDRAIPVEHHVSVLFHAGKEIFRRSKVFRCTDINKSPEAHVAA